MANINTEVWGTKENWVEQAIYQQSLDDKYKVYATQQTHTLMSNDKITLNVPWELSPSYCGLGTNSPLSHIKFLRRAVYLYADSEEWGAASFEDLLVEEDVVDDRTVTNFAFGTQGIDVNKNLHAIRLKPFHEFEEYGLEKYGAKYQRWAPDSEAVWGGGANSNWSRITDTNLWTQVPVRNLVAIPYIWCTDTIDYYTVSSDHCKVVDLETYLDTETQGNDVNINTFPYVLRVTVRFVASADNTTFSQNIRGLTITNNSCLILDQTNMLQGINPDSLDVNGEGYEPFESCYFYNQTSSWDSSDFVLIGNTSIQYTNGSYVLGRQVSPMLVPQGYTPPTMEEYRGGGGPSHLAYPIDGAVWVGAEYIQEKHLYNSNPQNPTQAATGHIIYYMNPGTVNDFREIVRRAVACFGLFFVDGDSGRNLALDDEKMMLGILENGIGNGQYSNGERNQLQSQWNWDDMHQNNYDPVVEPDIDDSGIEDSKNKSVLPTRGLLMPFTGSWVFDQANLTSVINGATQRYVTMQDAIEDWNLNKDELEDSLDFESYLWRQWGNNASPIECIQTITQYPFNIRPYIGNLINSSVIQIGSWVNDFATSASGDKVGASTTAGSIWCGGGSNSGMRFPITAENDFRSYAPYVSATLYLPFCGSIELDPQVFVGHNIKVQYIVDWRTGVCLALVYRDNLIVEAVSGQMGNKVNLQMLDGVTWASQLANASVQESNAHFSRAASFFSTVGGLVSIAVGGAITVGSEGAAAPVGIKMMAGGAAALAGGLMGMSKADIAENKAAYDIGTSPIPTRQISTASPAVNAANEMRVRLVVFKSVEESSTNYGHTVGHACLKYGTLSSLKCSGYTVCQTIDTRGISATSTEKEAIRQLLLGGVYV